MVIMAVDKAAPGELPKTVMFEFSEDALAQRKKLRYTCLTRKNFQLCGFTVHNINNEIVYS